MVKIILNWLVLCAFLLVGCYLNSSSDAPAPAPTLPTAVRPQTYELRTFSKNSVEVAPFASVEMAVTTAQAQNKHIFMPFLTQWSS